MEPTAWEQGFGPSGLPPGGNRMPQEGVTAFDTRGAPPPVHRNNHAASSNKPLVPTMQTPLHNEGVHNKAAGRGRSPIAPAHPHQQTPSYNGSQFAAPDKLPPPPTPPFFEEGGKPRGRDPANLVVKNGKTPAPGEQGGPAYQDALMELARENLLLKHQLHVASIEVGRLKEVVDTYNEAKGEKKDFMKQQQLQSRYWSEDEHQRFLVAIQTYGHKDVKSIASVVGTRSATQVRTHAQKYFMKLARSSTLGGEAAKSGGSNPDQDPSEGAEDQERSIKSMEAAAAAAAAAGEAGTSAAAAAAFVAATNNKQQSASKARSSKHAQGHAHAQGHVGGRNLGVKPAVHKPAATASLQSELSAAQSNLKPGHQHKNNLNLNGRTGSGKGPGSPGSMGSSGSVGCSDSTSASHGNGSNGIRSSDTTTGNGSSGSSNSRSRHRPDNGNRSSCDSNNGVSSTEGSDHGFFDTGAEEEENFPEELQDNAGTEGLCGLGPL